MADTFCENTCCCQIQNQSKHKNTFDSQLKSALFKLRRYQNVPKNALFPMALFRECGSSVGQNRHIYQQVNTYIIPLTRTTYLAYIIPLTQSDRGSIEPLSL